MVDTSLESPKAGGIIVEIFELILVTYLSFLVYALIKDEESLIILQEHVFFSLVTFQEIVRDCHDCEIVWLGNDRTLNVIEGTENPSDTIEDFLRKPLYAGKFYKICVQMLDENSHIDMMNTTATKKTDARCLDPSCMYLETCSIFHQNINTTFTRYLVG